MVLPRTCMRRAAQRWATSSGSTSVLLSHLILTILLSRICRHISSIVCSDTPLFPIQTLAFSWLACFCSVCLFSIIPHHRMSPLVATFTACHDDFSPVYPDPRIDTGNEIGGTFPAILTFERPGDADSFPHCNPACAFDIVFAQFRMNGKFLLCATEENFDTFQCNAILFRTSSAYSHIRYVPVSLDFSPESYSSFGRIWTWRP
jgi:hypothetical protein